MIKPISECSREDRLERALLAIECLSSLEENEKMGEIYMIAHVATNFCGNSHESWLKKIEEVEDFGRKNKLYDPEKLITP